jgi:LPPG:FO 2-phospho-L-lactate transferase
MLCGGLGGARLAPHLASRHRLTAVCNVADDLTWMGLHVSPDLDSVLYALAGCFDGERGYGVRGDTGSFAAMASRAGLESWFWLGDRDLQTHVLRTSVLRSGKPLSAATAALRRGLGVEAAVLPATDGMVRTHVAADGRDLDFQTFYVREGAALKPSQVRWEGIEAAQPAPGVLDALAEADLVVLAESSPVASLLPILRLAGVSEALQATGAVKVALSPVVAAKAPVYPVDCHHWRSREHLMLAIGLGHDPLSVASLYRELVGAFVIDVRDKEFGPAIAQLGLECHTADLLARSPEGRARLVDLLEQLARLPSAPQPYRAGLFGTPGAGEG